jgi:hypothetical protein
MPKLVPIGSYGQNQALWAHVFATNGPKTAEARPDWYYRDQIGIRTRPSYRPIRERTSTHVHACKQVPRNIAQYDPGAFFAVGFLNWIFMR